MKPLFKQEIEMLYNLGYDGIELKDSLLWLDIAPEFIQIDDVGKQLDIDFEQNKFQIGESIQINYCPICGKEL